MIQKNETNKKIKHHLLHIQLKNIPMHFKIYYFTYPEHNTGLIGKVNKRSPKSIYTFYLNYQSVIKEVTIFYIMFPIPKFRAYEKLLRMV